MIDREPGVALLDGAGDGDAARWSILAWRPLQVVAWPQGRPGALRRLRECLGPAPAGPGNAAGQGARGAHGAADDVPFRGGWIGWFSYDLGRHFERIPARAAADGTTPDFVLGEYDMALLEDRAAGRLYAAGRADSAGDEQAIRARAAAALDLAGAADADGAGPDSSHSAAPSEAVTAAVHALTDRATYRRCITRILAHISAGDIYQANYSHRFAARVTGSSGALYARLRAAARAPYGCYLDLPGGPQILSASPELFLRKRGRRLSTRPIKGTRPRSDDAGEDERLRAELEASEKERAELLMITDLLRNDLGRVAEYGSVQVRALREIESHATVHHAHSLIEAELRAGLGVADVIAAAVPGGSVTGAPKIRAMEILDRLEPLRRGPYTGCAGFIGDDGDACLNILIRTLVRCGDEVWYQVGGGIVADSDADAEYEETLAKGAALRWALSGD
jgi:para-aminobenzoate synthetase component 1